MQQQDADRVALQYLWSRGFTDVARAFQQQAGLQDSSIAVPPAVNKDGIAENLLFWHVANNDPAAYLTSFDRLAAWVDASLEMYRGELSRVLYPLFIHCYLELVAKGAATEARKMLMRAQKRFVEGYPHARGRAQVLQDLSNVSVPQHLRSNKTAQSFQSTRFPVRLSEPVLQLLLNYLQQARLYLLLNVINQRIRFQVLEGQPGTDLGADADEDLPLTATTDGQVVNRTALQLELLEDNCEDKFAEQLLDEEDAQARAQAEAEAQEETGKRAKAQKQKALDKEREAKRALLAEEKSKRIKPVVPMPAASQQQQSAVLEDIRVRADVSPTQLPSAIMFTFANAQQGLCSAATSPDAHMVVGGFQDSTVRLYDLVALFGKREAPGAASGSQGAQQAAQPMDADNDSQELRTWEDTAEVDSLAASCSSTTLYGHTDAVTAVDVSAGRELVVSGSMDGTLRLSSTELRCTVLALRGHLFPVWDVSFCPSGYYYFASAGADRVARIWCSERVQAVRMLVGHQSDVDVVRWHPNSHYVATGSMDRSVRLWDVATGKCVRLLTDHRSQVTALSFSPDGRHLASGDAHGTVMIWDLASAGKLGSASDHKGAVNSLAWSQGQGRLLASGGADFTVRVWDPAVGSSREGGSKTAAALQEVACWRTRSIGVYSLHFTYRNLLLAAGAVQLTAAVQ